MPQPRKYATNAERQAAYRRRKLIREAQGGAQTATPGTRSLVDRVMAADKAASR